MLLGQVIYDLMLLKLKFCNLRKYVKGTVARDFWPLVFFMNQSHIDL